MSAALVLFPVAPSQVLPRVWATASAERPLPPLNEGMKLQPSGGSLAFQPSGGSMGLQPHEFGAEKKGFSPGSLAVVARRIGPARVVAMQPATPVPEPFRSLAPELAFYRKYTVGMLRRYMKLSMESGRTPSLLGRELFRGHVTSYKVSSFEDVVMADLGVLKSQMDQLMGIGQPGMLRGLEARVAATERSVQRSKGAAGAFGLLLTVLHVAITYFGGRR